MGEKDGGRNDGMQEINEEGGKKGRRREGRGRERYQIRDDGMKKGMIKFDLLAVVLVPLSEIFLVVSLLVESYFVSSVAKLVA